MNAVLANFLSSHSPLAALARLGALFGVAGASFFGSLGWSLSMPGRSALRPECADPAARSRLAFALEKDVRELAGLGPRNFESYANLLKGAAMIENKFREAGLSPYRVDFRARPALLARVRGASRDCKSLVFSNVVAEVAGRGLPEEIVVVGAHYDSAPFSNCPGADDNLSGVAATLSLARDFAANPARRTVRFVAFVNEEPPFFWTDDMGSRVCAKRSAAAKERIVAMLTPECVGFYSDKPDSQSYPLPWLKRIYPDKGDFVAFVGNAANRALVRECVGAFRESCKFPSEGAALPFLVPGVGWSDHWSYAKEGYPALMVTDTATFRNPNYHRSTDTADKLDFEKMAIVVDGLSGTVRKLADKS